MSIPQAFSPAGQTFAANATTTSGAITITANQQVAYFNIVNTGSVPVYYRLTTNSSPTAAIPSPGSSAPGQMINAGDSQTIGIPTIDGSGVSAYVTMANIAVITASSSALVYIQPVIQSS